MRKIVAGVTLWTLTLLTMAAFVASAEPPPPDPQAARIAGRVAAPIPEAARKRPNPVPRDAATLETGAQLFATQCAFCHGAAGDGKGELAASLQLSVPDFTVAALQKRRTDGELFWILTKGHGSMPGDGERMSEEFRWALVHRIREFSPR